MPRRHTLVNETAESNTYIIEWDPGTGLDWHDHGDSAASIIVLQGSLYEETDDGVGSGYLVPDEGMYVRARGVRHMVENQGDEMAISVHTYSPPLVVTYGSDLEIG